MSQKRKNTIFTVIILAIVLLYSLSGKSIGISLDFCEDSLTVSADSYDYKIKYNEIENLELSVLADPGALLEGADKRSLRYGRWKNEAYGEYMQCVDPKINECIVITTKNGSIYVLNYQDSENTASLHKMFTELLQSKGIL